MPAHPGVRRDRDVREALGQLLRLTVAAPGSAAGKWPDGNTGRTRAGLTTSMPVPDDLASCMPPAQRGSSSTVVTTVS
ncbi:DUF3703 domain-containing protein [Streptomyces sp. NRRL F-5135]|uniref:DUF3703 domain-containing protein n=1 Tax=Streptomyces sp. NRRL F-5135 TaxID=1463858 RepID=UPI000560FBE0|nr:DUF3703 domain-containing protein [Streptomyces sp. NRRL F-5135]